MATTDLIKNPGARAIKDALKAAGFRCWFVGGCVRDALVGRDPKDIDLCTDAEPHEMIEAFGQQEQTKRVFLTGLAHGTVTVHIDGEDFEVTSLRTDQECDGRHATVSYTRDLNTDLERRDLTFNAMAMDFDGQIIDPFGGQADLEAKRTRMVGSASQRFLEDYLRILRFFRFHARFAGDAPLDKDAVAAIKKHKEGLKAISAERIWAEVSKIIVGPHAEATIQSMFDLGVAQMIGLPQGDLSALTAPTDDPAALMGIYLNAADIGPLANRWKWSRRERWMATFINERKTRMPTIREIKALIVDGIDRADIKVWLDIAGYDPRILVQWDTPRFPVSGHDVMERGFKGTEVGAKMKVMKKAWADSDYRATREELLKL